MEILKVKVTKKRPPQYEIFKEAGDFFKGLARAKEYHLEWEYTQWFLDHYKDHGDSACAANHALWEWDL